MSRALERLIEVLDLEEIERDVFRGLNENPDLPRRLFGGQVAPQALVAAGRTLENRTAHSLHAYFLRSGDPTIPVLYTVDRIRDGTSFTTRRVVAIQKGEAIFNMSASFHVTEEGLEHQPNAPEVPGPETLPGWAELLEKIADRIPEEHRDYLARERAIDVRFSTTPTFLGGDISEGLGFMWLRPNGALPEDPLLHQCVLTYASDMSMLDAMIRPHGAQARFSMMTASLDHALWMHRPVRFDDWFLFTQFSPVAYGARGYSRGEFYARDKTLVASVTQEALVRPLKKESSSS